VYQKSQQRIDQIINAHLQSLLSGSKIGLEKESLRVSHEGKIAQTKHPEVFGSALTHPFITTDYSEALLELITPPCDSAADALSFLEQTQIFVQQQLPDEILWANSMPCIVTGEASIPIAEYGHSNLGMMKTVYRRGLGHRYGRMMQVIAGIHFNYSLPESFWPAYQTLLQDGTPLQDFIARHYFAMIRNLQRFGWLIPYLFGASPAVCRSFIDGVPAGLEEFDKFTYYQPYATSLRLGDIGYQNSKEDLSGIKANYDSLEGYVASLTCAIETPYPEYEKIGIKINGEYQQLNSNLLQIENEYYSTVRPKQLAGREEKPSLALKRRGIKYVELRSLDLNVFEPLGANLSQLHFLEGFLLFCLLEDSPCISAVERKEIDHNLNTTAHRGREPGLQLKRYGNGMSLQDWGKELLDAMQGSFALLDEAGKTQQYSSALAHQREVMLDSDRTPSARIIAEMSASKEAFFPFSMRYSQQHAQHFRALPLSTEQVTFFQAAARESLLEQQRIEARDDIDFDEFLAHYFAQH
jgi:glutamate--cysteine ligase